MYYNKSLLVGNGSGIMSLNSPDGSTLQWGADIFAVSPLIYL